MPWATPMVAVLLPGMPSDEVILRFNNVSFEYGTNRQILVEAEFSLRRGSKVTLMGQNGAGKTTIFQLITKELQPEAGTITTLPKITMATAKQVIPRPDLELTVKEFFAKAFLTPSTSSGRTPQVRKVYDLDPRIDNILKVVHLTAEHD